MTGFNTSKDLAFGYTKALMQLAPSLNVYLYDLLLSAKSLERDSHLVKDPMKDIKLQRVQYDVANF